MFYNDAILLKWSFIEQGLVFDDDDVDDDDDDDEMRMVKIHI